MFLLFQTCLIDSTDHILNVTFFVAYSTYTAVRKKEPLYDKNKRLAKNTYLLLCVVYFESKLIYYLIGLRCHQLTRSKGNATRLNNN